MRDEHSAESVTTLSKPVIIDIKRNHMYGLGTIPHGQWVKKPCGDGYVKQK